MIDINKPIEYYHPDGRTRHQELWGYVIYDTPIIYIKKKGKSKKWRIRNVKEEEVLKEPVRKFSETFSGYDLLKEHFGAEGTKEGVEEANLCLGK